MVWELVKEGEVVVSFEPGETGDFEISGKRSVIFEIIDGLKARVTIPEGRTMFRVKRFSEFLNRTHFKRVIGKGEPIEIVEESLAPDWRGKGIHLRYSKER